MKYLILFSTLILLFFTQIASVAAEDPSDFGIWVDYDKGGYKVKNYYDIAWFPNLRVLYVGQHHYEWRVVFIENDNLAYDYYAVYVRQTLTPGIAYGYSNFKIRQGTTIIDLLTTGQMILDALPGRSGGDTTLQAGIGVSYGKEGPSGSFSASYSYSAPDVKIYPVTDAMESGYTKWDFEMDWLARDEQHTFYFTALIRVNEGMGLLLKIYLFMRWVRLTGEHLVTECVTISYDGTPSPPDDGGGGGGYIPAPPL